MFAQLPLRMKSKLIFLDRDGVINWDPIGDYIKCPDDFKFLPGVAQGLELLHAAQFTIVVISNQAGVGDGVFSEEALAQVTQKFIDEAKKIGVPIRHIYYCLHGKSEGCRCRKPQTGLFEMAESDVGPVDKKKTYFVGDKASDIEAGKRYGLKTIFVMTGHGQNDFRKLKKEAYPDKICTDLKTAAEFVIKEA